MLNDNSNPMTDAEASVVVGDSVKMLDDERLAGLQEFQQHQALRYSILQDEKTRLEIKYGSDHPLVQEINTRLDMHENLNAGLDQEISKSSIKNDPLPAGSWRIHGKVYDSEISPVQGYSVFLGDSSGNWNQKTGNSCTDETGYYSLTLVEKIAESLEKQPIYLSVSDKDKKIVYVDSEPLIVKRGMIIYREIVLSKTKTTCTPPENNNEESSLPKDAWFVHGNVTDEENKGVKGLTISLYDKELLFEDVLGTTLTDEIGNFEFIYRTEAFKDLFDKKPDIYLKVLDSSGKVIYTSKDARRPNAGSEETYMIKLRSKKQKQ